MATLEWVEIDDLNSILAMYSLRLKSDKHAFTKTLGHLVRRGINYDWEVKPPYPNLAHPVATLPASLSLDEAQRVAKLLLMVGE
jgi:hypothetical protein